MTQKEFLYYEIGQRSFLESREFEKVLKAIERGQRSPYYENFSQGATIVPHSLWFVEPIIHPKLGIDPTKPRLRTSEQAIKMAKDPYKDVRLEGEVESRFLYEVVTGSELAPFCTKTLQITVLPIEPHAGHYHIMRSEEAQRRGFSGLRNWLAIAEKTWTTKRREKADKLDIYQRIDYSRGLTSQSSKSKYRVLYNKDGTYLVGCVLENESGSLKLDSSSIKISGVCADDTILHFDVSDLDEAMFVVAMLNAPIVDSLIKPMQSRGQWGERHIQKKVLELPLPKFDPNNKKHMELVALTKQAHAKAQKTIRNLEDKYASIGKIRSIIKAELSEEILQIDKTVRELIIQSGNIPNSLHDFIGKS